MTVEALQQALEIARLGIVGSRRTQVVVEDENQNLLEISDVQYVEQTNKFHIRVDPT